MPIAPALGDASRRWKYDVAGSRDLRIDFLRGLAMACVIVDHSKLSSLLSWFTYERFWLVTAAEVFVVLAGLVLGSVYGRKLRQHGWSAVLRGLARRALVLYGSFVAVAASVVAIALVGVDVSSLATWTDDSGALIWTLEPWNISLAAWRDIALMRSGPWPFQIIGLYVWLVAGGIVCLAALRYGSWRPLLATSWMLYLLYRAAPRTLTGAQFEWTFPLLVWQLLFVHGIVIGYYREALAAVVSRHQRAVSAGAAAATAAFAVLALCNPWAEGPEHLRWSLVPPDLFTDVYFRYFTLTDLGIGRLLNLAVGLPLAYAVLTWAWRIVRPLGCVFIPLGRRSLGAFILHVYGILLIAHLPGEAVNEFWTATIVQLALIAAIAVLLSGMDRAARCRKAPRPAGAAA